MGKQQAVPQQFHKLQGTWEGEHKIYDAESGAFVGSYRTKVEMALSPSCTHASNRISNEMGEHKPMVLEFGSAMRDGVFEYENELIKGSATAVDEHTLVMSGMTKGTDSRFYEIVRYVSEHERVVTAQLLEGGQVKRVRMCSQRRTSKDGNFFEVIQ